MRKDGKREITPRQHKVDWLIKNKDLWIDCFKQDKTINITEYNFRINFIKNQMRRANLYSQKTKNRNIEIDNIMRIALNLI